MKNKPKPIGDVGQNATPGDLRKNNGPRLMSPNRKERKDNNAMNQDKASEEASTGVVPFHSIRDLECERGPSAKY